MRRHRWMLAGGLLIAMLASRGESQGWARSIGGAGFDAATDIARTADGGFIVTGTSSAPGSLTRPVWVLKLDGAGLVEWQQSVELGSLGGACCVTPTPDGGVVVAGNDRMLKFDASGAIQWQRSYLVGTSLSIRGLATLNDGSVTAVAWTGSYPGRSSWLLRLDPTGAIVRADHLTHPEGFSATAIAAAADGGLLVAGLIEGRVVSDWLIGLLRFDAAGSLASQTGIPTPCCARREDGPSVEEIVGGGWILAWSAGSGGRVAIRHDVLVMRLDASLGVAWATELEAPGTAWGIGARVRQVADGGYIVAGRLFPENTSVPLGNPAGAIAIKLDAAGRVEWQRMYGPGPQSLSSLVAMPDGGAVLAGSTSWMGGDFSDALLLRIDAAGEIATACGENVDARFDSASTLVSATGSGITVAPPVGAVSPPTAGVAVPTTASMVDLGDRYEPDDSCDRRTRLHEGETTRHDFCDDAEDWFELMACAGTTYTIATSNLGASADTVIYLVTPDCATGLVSDDDGGGGRSSTITWTAPADGSYSVLVRQGDGSAGGARGYDLRLDRIAGGCATWMRTYGMVGTYDQPVAVGAFPDGTFAVVGTMGGDHAPTGDDAAYVKLSAHGDVLRSERLFNLGSDTALDLATTASGGFVASVATKVRPPHPGHDEASLVAFDADGTIEWQRGYSEASRLSARIRRIRRLADGGFLAIGSSGIQHLWIVRLDALGMPTWCLGRGPAYSYIGTDLLEMPDGDLLVLASDGSAALVIRIDAMGRVETQRAYGALGYPLLGATAADGGFFLAGRRAVLKLDTDGIVVWRREIATLPPAWFFTSAFAATSDGGCVVTGTTSENTWISRRIILKLGAQGSLEWQRVMTGLAYGRPGITNIAETPDLGFIAAGIMGDGTVSSTVFVMRLDREGRIGDSCLLEDARLTLTSAPTQSTETSPEHAPGTMILAGRGFIPIDRGIAYEESCAGSNPRAPWEVSPPGSPDPLVFTDRATLRWEPLAASSSSSFNLYRGEVARLRAGFYGACLWPDLASNVFQDPATPSPGTIWAYLVTGENAAGEGTMGRTSLGTERVNWSPCP